MSYFGRVRGFVNHVCNPRGGGGGVRLLSVVVVAAVSFGGVSAADAHEGTTETYEEKVPVWEWVDEPVMATREVPVYSLVPTQVEVERTRQVPVYSLVPTQVEVERTRVVPVYSLVPTKVQVQRTREAPIHKRVTRRVRVAPFRQLVTVQPPCKWTGRRGVRYYSCPRPRTSWQTVYNYKTVTQIFLAGTRTETYTTTETRLVRKKTGTRTETYTTTETKMVLTQTDTSTETYTTTETKMVRIQTGTSTETYDTGATRRVRKQTGTQTVTRTRVVHAVCPAGYHELNSPNTPAWFLEGVVVFDEPSQHHDASAVKEVEWEGPYNDTDHKNCYQATVKKPGPSILTTVLVAGLQYVVSGGRTVIDGVTHIVEGGKVLTTKIIVAGVEHAITGGRAVINGVTYVVREGKVVATNIVVGTRSFAINAGRTVIDGVTHIFEGGKVLTTKIVVAGVEYAINRGIRGTRTVINGVTYAVEAGKVVAKSIIVAGRNYAITTGRVIIDGVTHIFEGGKVLTTKIVVAGVEYAINRGIRGTRTVINGVTYAVDKGKVVAKSIIVAGRTYAITTGRTVIDGVTHIFEGGKVLTTKIVVAGVEYAINRGIRGTRTVINGVTYAVDKGKVVAKSIIVAGRTYAIVAGNAVIDGVSYVVSGGKIVVHTLVNLPRTLKDAVVAEIKTGLERLEENAVAAICENRLTSAVLTGAVGLVLKPILVAALIKLGIAIPPLGITVAFFLGGVALFVLACRAATPWYTPDAPLKPTGLTLVSRNRSLNVFWDASPSRHTFRFGYDLSWKRSSQSWDDATKKALGDSVTSYRITGLSNGTVYNVRLEARNLGGDSSDAIASATPRGASPRSTPTPTTTTTTTTTTTVPSRSATPAVVTCSGRLTIQDMVKANSDVASGVITLETWRAKQRCWDKQRGH